MAEFWRCYDSSTMAAAQKQNKLRHDIGGTQLSVADTAGHLLNILGPHLTALIVGVTDATDVVTWSRGTSQPASAVESRLRNASAVVDLLMPVESPPAIRGWFLGMNPELADRAPAVVLAAEPELVVLPDGTFAAPG